MTSQRFSKLERLKSRKLIKRIFDEGRTVHVYPVRLVWIVNEDAPSTVQMAFSVPRRLFRKAVDRNLIRRRMFEAYRKNKYLLHKHLDQTSIRVAAMLIFTGREIMDYHTIEKALMKLLEKVGDTVVKESK